MITKEKLKIFKHYNGDVDGWARAGTKNEKKVMSDNDWFIIDNLIQDIKLIKNNLVSDEYEAKFDKKLEDSCDGEDTIKYLKQIAVE